MDGLSLVANIIAVVGAAQSVFQAIQRLRAAPFAPSQLSEMVDEVSNFQAVLQAVERKVVHSSQQLEDQPFAQHLERLLQKALGQLDPLKEAIDAGSTRIIRFRDERFIREFWKRWLRQNQLRKLCSELQRSRQDLAAALTVLTA